ncbi:MAG: hypothetical protein QGI35_00100 [Arenicellales bacterium]|nr:hypothetical protein [Arenicellales bacterium]
MRWVFMTLVLVNVAFYLWVTGHSAQNSFAYDPPAPSVNEGSMELLHESEARRSSRVSTDCLRIGPFATEETYTQGSRLLVNKGYGFTRNVVSARELRTFRVFAGPFKSTVEMDATDKKLEKLGLEHYTQQDKGGKILSIRTFPQGELQGGEAERFVAELIAQGLDVNVRPEVRILGPLRWLEVSDVVTEERRQALAALDWADALVRLAAVPCGVRL